jgi:DNA-binding transcriptional MerR regulator/GGDEF domain-containing protein
MDVRSKTTIREHLQKEDVQERILQYIQKGRDEATVTISRAADLFGITENKLRDWEEYGILNPLRPGGPKGRRLYTPAELDKLAVIRELINAGFPASEIPPDLDKLWLALRIPREPVSFQERQDLVSGSSEQLINLRVSQGRAELFWRYYVSQALRLSLMLISEDMPHTTVGLVLPLQADNLSNIVEQIEEVPALGESLIGWLSQSRSSHTLLTTRPSFQYSSDFRIEHLRAMKAGVPQDEATDDNTLIVIQRDAKPLSLSTQIVETIRHLLRPIYADVGSLRECFGSGRRDVLWPATDLESSANYEDVILNGLCDIIVHLGGMTDNGQPRWRFSSVFLPHHPSSVLSLQQRSLIVRAQSENSPYVIGITTHIPQEPFLSTCIKAFQSGHTIYLPSIKDPHQPQLNGEGVLQSSIAVPIDGYDGIALAVLYVASAQKHAFSEGDQRVLRIVGRMIREVLETYQIRYQAASRLRDILTHPAIVDTHFQEFLAEDDFIQHVEMILSEVQGRTEFTPSEVASFIAIDIDNQSGVANRYGGRMARDLCRAVGMRIHSQLRAFKDATEYKLYHICADRFYILLNSMTLEQARSRAELLKQTLEGTYSIDPYRSPTSQPTPTENMVTLTNTTVRLGVSSYPYPKLKEVLLRYSPDHAVNEVRMQITGFLEEELALGKQKGGNIVMSWDPSTQGFVRVSR